MIGISALPEGCIAAVISFTSPRDTCCLACVSTIFKSAADSNVVWDRFLPKESISGLVSVHSSTTRSELSKKELYLRTCHNLIKNGELSFWLDYQSGKKCYMISSRECQIEWGDTPMYWNWISLPEARFPDVARLIDVCLFDIQGKINISVLSPRTIYAAYFVFRPTDGERGFTGIRIYATVRLVGSQGRRRTIYLDTNQSVIPPDAGHFNLDDSFVPEEEDREEEEDHGLYVPRERADGWLETKLGNFVYQGHEDGELEIIVMENRHLNWKSGLIFQGIEIRPKNAT